MPELPDVEVYKRYVDATSLHRRISNVYLRGRLVQKTSPQTIRHHLRGSALTDTRRHGKHLFLRSSGGGWLRLHFGMTGSLHASSAGDPPQHTELGLDFEDGSRLAYVSERRLGHISWVDEVDTFIAEHELGPDPLADETDHATFDGRITTRRGSIKGTLMNQKVVAGLGNVYVDEILFQAGVHPESDTQALTDEDRKRLFAIMKSVIEKAIDRRAEVENMPDGWLLPHREPGQPCPRCSGHITRLEVSGRATYYCPDHQERSG